MHWKNRGAILAAILFVAMPVIGFAQNTLGPVQSRISDEAGMFKKSAVESATHALETAEREYHVPVVIEVVESLKGRPIEASAGDAAKLSGGVGLFVFIAKDEKKLFVLTRRQFEHRFPPQRRDAIRDAFTAGFKTGDFDEGLSRGVKEITENLKATAPMESPLVTRDRIGLTLAGAKKALAAAEAKAAEMNIKANIAVVDDGGHLLAFARMDGARPASAATAQTKATSAATMRQASGPMPAGSTSPDLIVSLALPGAAAASGAKITTLFGGVPIIVDGQVIGAVGVGGGTGEQDAEIAKAGASAVSNEASTKPNSK
jgi:glc operon protein GlcG